MPRIRVIVTGDRHWDCLELAGAIVNRLLAKYGPDLLIVHGGAPGVDSSFDGACHYLGVARERHPADWETHGKAAGPIRNAAMVVAGATLAIAVHRDLAGSRGTRDTVRRCIAAGIPVFLIDSEDVRPRRITTV